MKIEHSTQEDIPTLMSIFKDAQQYLASLGIDQWQNGYPTEEKILSDIACKGSYVVRNDDNQIIGTTFFSTDEEPTYRKIRGNWITANDAKYGVIHRIAVFENHRGSGFAAFVFDHFEKELIKMQCPSMRVDTHEDNLGMQKLLLKRGYKQCGIINILDGSERLAFEKVLL